MILTLLVIILFTFSGTVLTYLYSDEDRLMVRLASGHVFGSALFGLIAFLCGCAFGLTPATILLSLAVSLLPLVMLVKGNLRERVFADFTKTPELNFQNSLAALFYLAFLLIFYFFFARAMVETGQGIFTGASQNLGDLPFHLGAIFSFSEGQNLPPENPSFAFAKFTYPFMADFLAACYVALGASARHAMLVQNLGLCFALLVLFENFAWRLTKNRLAGKLAAVIFLFCGGLGFLIFFRDYLSDGRPFFEFLLNLPADYTVRQKGIRFGNTLVTLFITQRGFLLGMPITLITLTYLWKVFTAEKEPEKVSEEQFAPPDEAEKIEAAKKITTHHSALSAHHSAFGTVAVGLLAGTLVLTHVHSLAVLFIVSAFLFFFRLDQWRIWTMFGISVAVLAVPEFVWIMTGSATRLTEFIDWNFGWDAQGENIVVFWLKNAGLFIPLLIVALWKLRHKNKDAVGDDQSPESEDQGSEIKVQSSKLKDHKRNLLLFYVPFLLVFILCNLVKFAPWEWDNIKILIYWYVASVPLVAWLLARLWENGGKAKLIAIVCLLVLTFSGALDIWRVATHQINYGIFNRDAIRLAEEIKQKTAPNALFLNAPTYNSAVVLAGRRSLMRYSGHLASYGIDYFPRETEVKRIYEGTALAEPYLKKHGIEYVIISPEEKANLTVNEAFFSRYPVIAQIGEYRVYQIKK